MTMKLKILLMLTLSVSLAYSLSIRSIMDRAAGLFHFKDKSDSIDPNRDCAVHRFPSVDKIEARKLTGDWFEIGRTITKLPVFSSGTWRFQDHQNLDEEAFFFTGRLINGHCCAPFIGKAIASNTNPGTFVLNYDGLKSRVEEELKVIFNDLNNALVLYGCSRLSPTGNCLPEATFVTVLSRQKTLSKDILEKIYESISSVCIDPHTLIIQNTTNTCNFDDLDPVDWKGGPESEWPTCQKTATCTIACPRCCEEDSEGCISCDCGVSVLQKKSLDCKKDVSECNIGCFLEDKSPGCQVCYCSSIQASAPMVGNVADSSVKKINQYGECPTACRTPKIDNQLYCDCTNQDICNKPSPYGNCNGNEEHYTFDRKTGTCPAYLGNCEHTENSFDSVRDCLGTCADVCDLHVDVGPCKGDLVKYYYNRVTGTCETFIYGGCKGNENNYETKDECLKRCPAKFESLLVKANEKDVLCSLPVEKGTCTNIELKYAYILEANTCVTFPYGGCQGNGNNFETKEACEIKCKNSNTQGDSQRASECSQEYCLEPCEGVMLENGCIECTCPDGATSLTMALSNVLAITLFVYLAY